MQLDHLQLKKLFPNASQSCLDANRDALNHPEDTRKATKLERGPGAGALGKGKAEKADPEGFSIRIVSVRKRLIDPDNLVCKYAIDCCRYAGLLPEDNAETIRDLSVSQRKCQKGEEEHTEITISLMP